MPAPILVTGSNRSGTTWLGRLLAEAHGTVFVNEIFNLDHAQPGLFAARFPHWFMYLDDDLGRPYVEPLRRTLEFHYDWADAPDAYRRRATHCKPSAPIHARGRSRRAASAEGSDRGALGALVGAHVRHAGGVQRPPPGRLRREPEEARLDVQLSQLHLAAPPHGRAAAVRPRPDLGLRGQRARSSTRPRSCAGDLWPPRGRTLGCLYGRKMLPPTPSRACRRSTSSSA